MAQRHNPPRHVKFNPKVTLQLRQLDLQAQKAVDEALAPFKIASDHFIRGLFTGHGISIEGYDIQIDQDRRGASLVQKDAEAKSVDQREVLLELEPELPVTGLTEQELREALAKGEEVPANGTSDAG